MRQNNNDSNEHMLITCPVSSTFWQDVEKWIAELTASDYNLSNNRVIVGGLENRKAINQIILFGKVCIFIFEQANTQAYFISKIC